jgi:choline dehydrogenase
MRDADLIVVGGGSGGAVLAARCSAHMDVLLLEAGAAPTRAPVEVAGPNFHRAYAHPGRRWPDGYASGRGLGGSSAVNAMVASIDPADIDSLPISCRAASASERGPVGEALLRAGSSFGLATAPLLLTRSTDGRRCSVVEAYLEPALRSGRLTVLGDALVDRVLLDGGAVHGVRLADGRSFSAPLVAVAAGAVRTPGVLVRSGVALAGVGVGLQEHPTTTFPLRLRSPLTAEEMARVVSVTVGGTASWRVAGDVQVVASDAVDAAHAALLVSLLYVESRGEVRVVSPDPAAEPVFEPRLLADERDADGMRYAEGLVEGLLHSDALVEVAEWSGERVAGGAYHAASTCRMGRASDPLAVVDAEGRVHGTEGLLVCDASVFPRVPLANPHIPVVRFAEHAAAALCRGRNTT